MSVRYKIWVQLERITMGGEDDDDVEDYQNIDEPICIGDFDDYSEGYARVQALGLLFDGLTGAEKEVIMAVMPSNDDDPITAAEEEEGE